MNTIRIRWLLYRQWAWPIQRWWRVRNCNGHIAGYSTWVGTMRDFGAGLPGMQQVRCANCGSVMAEFA